MVTVPLWFALLLVSLIISGAGPALVWLAAWPLHVSVGWWPLVTWAPSAPVLLLLVVWLADSKLPGAPEDATDAQRAAAAPVLPRWLAWFNTPDDPGSTQGQYEPQVKGWLLKYGWRVKTYLWLGWRNQMLGLFRGPLAARGTPTYRSSARPFPRSKGPYTPGVWWATARIGSRVYFELDACWGWPWTSHCANPRMGWRVQDVMAKPGEQRLVFLFQPLRLWITRDSVT